MNTHSDIQRELQAVGLKPDDELDVAHVALALAMLDCPKADRAVYDAHLTELAAGAREISGLPGRKIRAADEVALELSNLLAGQFAYRGDSETYEDPKNANLIHVIDCRKGLPVALGILYLHAARAAGLDMHGLNFPGHFVLRLHVATTAVILDPFNGGAILTPTDLRDLLRGVEGPEAKLSPDACAAVTDRDILLRLQNNILGRALRAGEIDRARDVVTRMIWIAPRRSGLHFELGRIEVHAGRMAAASQAFSRCRDIARDDGEMRIAGMADEALRRLKAQLN